MPLPGNRLGGLLGLLVGDAVGVPYEFHPPSQLPPMPAIDLHPPAGFPRAHAAVPPGTWSDDGAQALALLDSLLARDGLDLEHFSAALRAWWREGRYAVDGLVFDVGLQTQAALLRLEQGHPPERAGPDDEHSNGNGSLMRVLPLALWHRGDDTELALLAARQSLPTHGHARSQVACAMYCLWARAVMEGARDPWAEAETRLHSVASGRLFPPDELDLVLDPANRERASGSGYVVDTLWSARLAVERSHGFEDCIRHAIAFGHDTDTTAAVAGGIAGLRDGVDGIPARWRDGLRGGEVVAGILRRGVGEGAG